MQQSGWGWAGNRGPCAPPRRHVAAAWLRQMSAGPRARMRSTGRPPASRGCAPGRSHHYALVPPALGCRFRAALACVARHMARMCRQTQASRPPASPTPPGVARQDLRRSSTAIKPTPDRGSDRQLPLSMQEMGRRRGRAGRAPCKRCLRCSAGALGAALPCMGDVHALRITKPWTFGPEGSGPQDEQGGGPPASSRR